MNMVELLLPIENAGIPSFASGFATSGSHEENVRSLFVRPLNVSNPIGHETSQWASKVIRFTSEWDSEFWAAANILGPSMYFDSRASWSPSGDLNICDEENVCEVQREQIELSYSRPVFPTAVLVYESAYPGSTVRLEVCRAGKLVSKVGI